MVEHNCNSESINESIAEQLHIKTYEAEEISLTTSTGEIVRIGIPWLEHRSRPNFGFFKGFYKSAYTNDSIKWIVIPILEAPKNCEIAIKPRVFYPTINAGIDTNSPVRAINAGSTQYSNPVLDVYEFSSDSLLYTLNL